MVQLGIRSVCLKASISSKSEAIQKVGDLLTESGNIEADYVESMMRREQQANTYLGNGIAIPHGQPQDRDLIHKTGIAVVQIPAGVEWNPGETVHLVVGIAAKSDEHLQILTNLTHVLDDEAAVQQLTHTDDPEAIIERLTQGAPTGADRNGKSAALAAQEVDQAVDVTIEGGAGLHARPATVFAEIAKSFEAEVQVRHGDRIANGKSLMSLLQLGVEPGSTIRILTRGRDADQALQALQTAVEDGLEEEEEAAAESAVEVPELGLETAAIAGIAAAPGMAIAPLHHYERGQLVYSDTAEHPDREAQRLREAVETAKADLTELYQTVKQRSGADKAAIFQAHREFLDDPALLEAAIAKLPPNRSAPAVWQEEIEERANSLAALSDPLLAGRAADVRDVGQRVLKLLADRVEAGAALPDHPVILIADDLTPSDTASFDPDKIQGFCTAKGGATSHTAIMARSLNIPAMVGAGDAVLDLSNGGQALLDGDRGALYPEPSETDLETARQAQQERRALQDMEWNTRYQPALTKDGHRIEVVANIGAPAEAEQAVNAGGEGVGLLRTEFLFLNRTAPPSEEEQFAAYTQMTQALNGLPLIIRTLDIGGDKAVPYLNLPKEDNPFLGVRGVRLCFEQPELFETQLRAILRAAATGYVRIMFPMIATLEDIRRAKDRVAAVRADLNAPPVEIGMMVEVPSAVFLAAEFAQEVDFFSVGTNDLTQYLLAIDRGHPVLAKQADALHPAVLRAIQQTVQAAQAHDKWVGVCGGMAGDPLGAILLAGLGVHELSMTIPNIPAVKAKLRSQSLKRLQKLAQKALKCRTAAEVRQL
ncbi:phosphoenolpyruvate--protein phosphotransferase [Vacuolonema iberomarrocanum]|uniref:phosphoenolpyruvate--protein phosphotransferase n=1 Tax=Vacuolonema iberomarrocanum TaxID=3454632 RepID=UPI0019E25DE2|nr:phosphoenolpyruvate--protein phosphotransferase [filamentous cyanobacterium LEGE 07170]